VTSRRFPAPWRAEPIPGGYIVRDANGQALAYLHSRDNPSEALQAKMLTPEGARDATRSTSRGCLSCLGRRSGISGVWSTVWRASMARMVTSDAGDLRAVLSLLRVYMGTEEPVGHFKDDPGRLHPDARYMVCLQRLLDALADQPK
jgi:hypothetical protein